MDRLPLREDSLLLRCVFTYEVSVLDGSVSQTAFAPLQIDSSAFTPKGEKDKGLLSTEHGDRPGSAPGYKAWCDANFRGVAGIWAVSVAECDEQALPPIADGGEDGKPEHHVSIDFTSFIVGDRGDGAMSYNLTKQGKRKARFLRDRAVERQRRA